MARSQASPARIRLPLFCSFPSTHSQICHFKLSSIDFVVLHGCVVACGCWSFGSSVLLLSFLCAALTFARRSSRIALHHTTAGGRACIRTDERWRTLLTPTPPHSTTVPRRCNQSAANPARRGTSHTRDHTAQSLSHHSP